MGQKSCVLLKHSSSSLNKLEYEISYKYLPNGSLASEEKVEWTNTGDVSNSQKVYNYSGKNKLSSITHLLNNEFQKTVYYVFDKKDNQVDEYTSFNPQPVVKNPVTIASNGNLTKNFYDESGKITGKELKEYNATGNLLKREIRDADDNVAFSYTFNYTGNTLKAKSKFDQVGKIEEVNRYAYNSQGLLEADSTFVNGMLNSIMTYTYDANKLKTKQTHYSSDLEPDYYITYEYNNHDQLVKETFYYHGEMLHSTESEYDTFGNKVKEIYKDQKPLRVKTWEYSCPK